MENTSNLALIQYYTIIRLLWGILPSNTTIFGILKMQLGELIIDLDREIKKRNLN